MIIRLLCLRSQPNTIIPSIQSLLFQFLWKNKPDKIKRQILYQDYCDGGLRSTNVEIMLKSLRLAWIQYLLIRDGDRDALWALITTKAGLKKVSLLCKMSLTPMGNLCHLNASSMNTESTATFSKIFKHYLQYLRLYLVKLKGEPSPTQIF